MAIPFKRPTHNPYTGQQPYPGFAPPQPAYQSTGLLQQLLGGTVGSGQGLSADGIMNTLNHIQRFLGLVQTTAPMLQQYGPVVKNLPAMYQMMKALNSSETDDLETDSESDGEAIEAEGSPEDFASHPNDETQLDQSNRGQSVPKLFI